MLVEHLPPRLGNHLCGFQQLFWAYLTDKTASMASSISDNSNCGDPGGLLRFVKCMRLFLGHVHTGSAHMWKCCAEAEYGFRHKSPHKQTDLHN